MSTFLIEGEADQLQCVFSLSLNIFFMESTLTKKIAAFISRVEVTFGSSFLLDEDL